MVSSKSDDYADEAKPEMLDKLERECELLQSDAILMYINHQLIFPRKMKTILVFQRV
jgi:hypothetical protein